LIGEAVAGAASAVTHSESRKRGLPPVLWLVLVVIVIALAAGAVWMLVPRRTILDRRPGQVVADFELRDVRTGQRDRLSHHRGRVVAIVFAGTRCPVGDLYLPRWSHLGRIYETRDVDFLAINSNASESIDDVADHARQLQVTVPVLKDPENRVADQLLVERTCEALVIDGRGRLRYRGAIDDQYGLGTRRDNPERNYLVDAIEAVLAGREVSPEMTPVVGCPIERVAPMKPRLARAKGGAAAKDDASSGANNLDPGPVTYAADVAAILHRRCASCHRPGRVAPFSLLKYDDARRWAASISEVLAEGRMPPWHADPRYGRFTNDRRLTAHERSQLSAWIEQGTPPGDLAQAPHPPSFSHGWEIGTPDIILDMPEPFLVQAEGIMPIQHFRLAPHHTEDLWIQAAEARPGNRAVVHHICIYIDDPKEPQVKKSRVKNLLVAYTPGDVPAEFPPAVAKKVPAGSELIFEVHYTPIGKVTFDRSSVGLILAKEPPRHRAVTRGIACFPLNIPPRAPDFVARSGWKVRTDVHLLSMAPHMHLRGKSFVYTASYPDGRNEVLLAVPAYDFNWQSVYRLAEPVALPAGSEIHCEAHFDNSAENLANPDPDQSVVWGEQSWDEMMIGFIDYYEDRPIPSSTATTHASH
jgi:hypothetical protein